MTFPALPRFGTAIDRALDIIESALRRLAGMALADAVVLPPQLINTTDTRIYHGLGRLPRGYWIVKSPAVVNVVGDGLVPESKDPANFMTLRMAFPDTVTLIVF